MIGKAEVEAAGIVAAATAERDAAALMAGDLVTRAEDEAREVAAAEQARLASLGEDAATQAVELLAKAEAEAEEVLADARSQREDAAARAVELIAKAENEAEDVVRQAASDATTDRTSVLDARAELAAEQDALAMEREAFAAELASWEPQRQELAAKREKIEADTTLLRKKQGILAEAQEAFVTERTLLQRRWAEVEQQGVAAMEKAHEEAETILRKAREQASAIASPVPTDTDAPGSTAQEALARLDSVLNQARDVVAKRAEAEEDEAGLDNETATSGVWDQVGEETVTGRPERPSNFEVPRDQATTGEANS